MKYYLKYFCHRSLQPRNCILFCHWYFDKDDIVRIYLSTWEIFSSSKIRDKYLFSNAFLSLPQKDQQRKASLSYFVLFYICVASNLSNVQEQNIAGKRDKKRICLMSLSFDINTKGSCFHPFNSALVAGC